MRKEVEKRVYEVFEKSVADIRKPEDVRNFITDLLTPTEKIMLAKRLAIAVLLSKDYGYRSISRILKVSFATINSVAKQNAIGGSGYKAVVNKILREEKLKETFINISEELNKLFSHPLRHGKIESIHQRKRMELADEEI